MARIASSRTQFIFGDGTAAVSQAISAATKAKPAVLTVASSTGIVAGDLVHVTGTGLRSLDDRVFPVSAVTATTITLAGSDSVADTGTLVTATAKVDGFKKTSCCLSTFARTSPPAAQIDVTSLCDTVRKKVPGITDVGTFRFDGFYDSVDPGYQALLKFWLANENRCVAIVPQDASMLTFWGSVTAMTETFGVDQAVTFTGEGIVSGPVTYAAGGTLTAIYPSAAMRAAPVAAAA